MQTELPRKMKVKKYGNTPLKFAELPKEDGVIPEAESGLSICLHKLKKGGTPSDQVLFDNVTTGDLVKVLKSAHSFIDVAKFELGENF